MSPSIAPGSPPFMGPGSYSWNGTTMAAAVSANRIRTLVALRRSNMGSVPWRYAIR